MAKAPVSKVPANPGLIEWPADPYGASSILKQAITDTASRLNGQVDKKDVVVAVLRIAIEHVEARFASQVEENKLNNEWRQAQFEVAEAIPQPKGYRSR